MSTAGTAKWFLFVSGPCNAAFNMAADEALLEWMPVLGAPVLRFYGWTEPAATFGYFQHYADVEAWTPLRPLVRRPTGGGIVPHDCDWTYSLAFPAGHPWHALRAIQSYRAVHEWIRDSFLKLGIKTSLAPAPNKTLPGRCFEGYEEADLLFGPGKIAGAAQRRTKAGLLIQGSVHSPRAMAREIWHEAMCAVMEPVWGKFTPLTPGPDLQARMDTLAAAKYGTDQYNRKR